MSEYDFILDNMRFSYSSVNSFGTCQNGFKLTYIDAEERKNNFFAEFGSLVHLVNEKYFRYELDVFELSAFYEENYPTSVVSSPPPYPAGMADKYYQDGLDFFDNFTFDRDLYEILFIEDGIDTVYEGVKLIVKPDLVLRDKETGKVYLYDYKTAKYDKKKIKEYKKQMYLYAFFLDEVKKIHVDEIRIWFVRSDVIEKIPYDWAEAQLVLRWFYDEIEKIKKESDWKPNLENNYFCDNLCSVKAFCTYYQNK